MSISWATDSAPESLAGGTTHWDSPDVSVGPSHPVEFTPDLHATSEPVLEQRGADATKANKCPQCCSTGARNLVVCIDGTSNQFSTKNTNVVELYSRLVKDEHQLTFYNSGIGTYAKPSWKSLSYRKQVIANKFDLAFALRFEKIIISAYAWLVDNYQPGDRIFLFGFSRGAYQVRALSAMIDVVGLLYKGNDDQIPFAYELYAAAGAHERSSSLWNEAHSLGRRLSTVITSRLNRVLHKRVPSNAWPVVPPEGTIDGSVTMQDQFKATFSRPDVRVHFVGAWDTVSSVGFIRDKTLPKTTDGMRCACFFRHALALHEYRVKFLPEYVSGSNGPDPEDTPAGTEPHTKEVWFMGSHSDIGGGSTANTTLDKFGPALRWMSYEATLAGLRIKEGPRKWEQVRVSKSMTPVWRIAECLPIKRLSYTIYPDPGEARRPGQLKSWFRALRRQDSFSTEDVGSEPMYPDSLDPPPSVPPPKHPTTWLPHLCAHRDIQPGQRVHQSVSRQQVPFWLPAWAKKEHDSYIEASIVLRQREEVLQRGRVLDEGNVGLLAFLTSTRDGLNSLRELKLAEYIYNMARSCHDSPSAPQILKDLWSLEVAFVKGAALRDIDVTLRDDAFESTSSKMLETFAFGMCGHTSEVSSVVFLSNTRMISGSWDETLRIWDTVTGEMVLDGPLLGHAGFVNCVAVCSNSGLIASASDDSTIRLWRSDSAGRPQPSQVLRYEGDDAVGAVAFAPDGSHIVSGWTDGAVRVWNTLTGEQVGEPARQHTGGIRSLAFSPDGMRIVTGSEDQTVRVWRWPPRGATLQAVGKPLVGHTYYVCAVAFSPDSGLIASGSGDCTIRLWDGKSRALRNTLEGHIGWVTSVAFAPSGMHLASASYDWTVRIWDTQTGAVVRVLLGHTRWVRSVAYSPDGGKIASGSDDRTVRVWDVNPVEAALPESISNW